MNQSQALRYAGPGTVLVARPHSPVVHVADRGPLTPSGRFIPRNRSTVCGVRTRRLTVLSGRRGDRRVCAHCTRTLTGRVAALGLVSREDHLATWGHTTLEDLAVEVTTATTLDEVADAAHVLLLVHGHHACTTHLIDGQPLSRVIGRRRRALTGPTRLDHDLAEHREAARRTRAAERKEAHQLRLQQATRR